MMPLPHARLTACWPEEHDGETEAEKVFLYKLKGGLP